MKQKHWPADNVIRRKVSALVPYARNSRTHSPEQVDQIAASIKEWGFTTPILVDTDGQIIAGHGRLLAAQKLGLDEVPTMTAEGWTDAQKKAYVIADNKLALNAGWDNAMLAVEMQELGDLGFDLDLTGFGKDEIGELFPEDAKDSNEYSQKVDVPTYEPSGEKPLLEDLYDEKKSIDLINEIQQSSLKEKEKKFLMSAASRHTIFNYEKIANFYAHSTKECQQLMEKSALVIVDYEQAIKNGFVLLTSQIDDLNDEE
jgi:hypothetical protein